MTHSGVQDFNQRFVPTAAVRLGKAVKTTSTQQCDTIPTSHTICLRRLKYSRHAHMADPTRVVGNDTYRMSTPPPTRHAHTCTRATEFNNTCGMEPSYMMTPAVIDSTLTPSKQRRKHSQTSSSKERAAIQIYMKKHHQTCRNWKGTQAFKQRTRAASFCKKVATISCVIRRDSLSARLSVNAIKNPGCNGAE